MFKNPVTNEYFVTSNNQDVVVEIPKSVAEEAKRRHDITLKTLTSAPRRNWRR